MNKHDHDDCLNRIKCVACLQKKNTLYALLDFESQRRRSSMPPVVSFVRIYAHHMLHNNTNTNSCAGHRCAVVCCRACDQTQRCDRQFHFTVRTWRDRIAAPCFPRGFSVHLPPAQHTTAQVQLKTIICAVQSAVRESEFSLNPIITQVCLFVRLLIVRPLIYATWSASVAWRRKITCGNNNTRGGARSCDRIARLAERASNIIAAPRVFVRYCYILSVLCLSVYITQLRKHVCSVCCVCVPVPRVIMCNARAHIN